MSQEKSPNKEFHRPRREHQNQVTLEIGSGVISDAGIRGLLEDWLIPLIVEDLMRDRMNDPRCLDPPSLTPTDIL